MGARGGVGLEIELDHVPQREIGMSSYEIMLSESQERMLLVAQKGREHEVLNVFEKWGLDASIVGTVIGEPRMRVLHHGVVEADIPNQSLTDDAPVYHRPVGTWKPRVPLDPPAEVLEELKKPRDYTADLKKLLASSNICSKRWVYEQYDSMVQTNTVQGPGGEAGVMRIKGTDRGLAMALAGNSRWCYLDPKLGAMHAVAEAARKVACTGATPVAATNCLNFGNPEKPEIMAQFSAAIDGIAEACNALGTPITGGNVSLYNETKGEGIYPTPVLGIVGLLDDVTKAVPAGFQQVGDDVLLLIFNADIDDPSYRHSVQQNFGSSEFAKHVLGHLWGVPPGLSLDDEAKLQRCLIELADRRLLRSAKDSSDGAVFVAVAEATFLKNIGFESHRESSGTPMSEIDPSYYWTEFASTVIVSCDPASSETVIEIAKRHGASGAYTIGRTVPEVLRFHDPAGRVPFIDALIADLKQSWSSSLESALHDNSPNEVFA
jgi:phosphoribosylformylglycinamidine synthase subunit PurL